jgi:hypothetical protein
MYLFILLAIKVLQKQNNCIVIQKLTYCGHCKAVLLNTVLLSICKYAIRYAHKNIDVVSL